MSPLVLLGLLTFFFAIAVSFALWSVLTLGDAARRHGAAALRRSAGKQEAERGARAARQQSSFEAEQPRPNPALRASRPQPAEPKAAEPARFQPRPSSPQAQVEAKPTPGKDEERVARVVVTPRKVNDDAFERFLESEKRRD